MHRTLLSIQNSCLQRYETVNNGIPYQEPASIQLFVQITFSLFVYAAMESSRVGCKKHPLQTLCSVAIYSHRNNKREERNNRNNKFSPVVYWYNGPDFEDCHADYQINPRRKRALSLFN